MSLNLAQAWKGIPPPPPDVSSAQPVASNGAPGQPDGKGYGPQAIPGGDSPALPPTEQGAVLSGQQPASSSPPQAEEPPRLRSLFEHPLVSSPSDAAWKPDPARLQQLAALVLHRHEDPELDDILAKNPAWHAQASLDDGSMPARAMLGQQIAREVLGESHANEPGLYFLAVGEKLPQSATRQEAYAAICDHYTREAEQRYVDNKNRRAAWQANRAALEKLIPQVVSGLKTPEQLTAELTPAQLIVYNREFDPAAVGKAHAAFQLLRQAFSSSPEEGLRSMIDQGLSRRITSCLSDTAQDGSAVLNETALELFEVSLKTLMADVQEQSGDQYKFLHNARLALFSPLRKRGDDIRILDATHQAAEQAGTAAIAAGMMEAIGWESGKQNAEARMEMKTGELAALREEWLRHRAADTQETRVLGLLSQGQDLGNQPNDRASFTSRTVNCLGSVVGQTMPFFVPGAGWGIALAGAFDDRRNRAYYAGLEPGTAEWSAFIDAAASTAVEKISFGAIGKFSGAGWFINKLPAASKLRRTLSDALWQRVLFETGAGIVEETVAEPTAEAVIQWIVRNNLAPLAKLDVGGKYDWNNYWQELRGMLSPDQLMATALFVGGLSGMQAPSIRRSLVTYSKNAEMLMTQGIPKEEAQRISQIENDSERIAAARQAREKAWGNDEQAAQNAREGMAAFRHLGEVQATIESEAYKYFQKQYNLPTVEEKLDAPGTYAVTVYDRDSGKKKFTQDMTGDQLVALFGRYFSRAEQEEVRRTQSEFAANAFLRAAEATGEIQAQDMLQWGHREDGHPSPPARTSSPASASTAASGQGPQTSSIVPHTSSIVPQEASLTTLGGFIRAIGAMSQTAFSHLARIATQEYRRRTDSGMSAQEAAATPFAALSPYVPLGSMMELDKAFAHRLDIAKKTTGEEGLAVTRLFRMSTAPGTTPADTLFLLTRGSIGSRELLEDLFEWKLGKLVLKDPVRLQAIASLLRDTQASMQKLGFKGQFVEPRGELSDMQIVEAMSKLALSDMLSNADSLPLPQWQKDLLQYHVNTLGDAAYLLHIGQAYNAGRKAGTITQDMADILRDLGHEVHTVFDTAKIQQADIQAVMDARAIIDGRDPSGTPTASQIRERQQKDAEEEKAHITTGDKGKERSVPKEAYRHPETISLPEAPSSMLGVFANGASWNPDAGTWLGMVPVDKLHLSPEVPQVKVGSGKKGVVNPLVGDYRSDAPPVYVWKRKNGRLEVVSGRHRLDLAQRTGTKNIPAYVYEEDAAHDAKWARLLDYEQNMQDDQADELTAAIYVRETGLTDAELTRRGLTRSGTKSRRGLLIGREARQELWSRFKSGLIKAQDAEAICLLTQHIQDKTRIDAIQAQAAADLAKGKSLDFAAAKIQLMIHAPQDGGMVQGLISFGASFDEALERSAEYVARCIAVINEHINAIKGVRTIAKKGTVMEAEGITAGLSADPAQRLRELELLKAMYEKIGLYENLRFRALVWNGKTPPDPIGDHRLDMLAEQARAQEEAAARQEEENRKASEALTPGLGFSLAPSPASGQSPANSFNRTSSIVLRTSDLPWFPSLWKEAARELNSSGRVSFSLNGSRIAIHTLSEEKMRHALKLGGMPNPAVQIADLDSGPTHYGEIACILHPDRIDPAKTPGARIWRGDAWTRQMPEKISEDGDPWEGYEHGPEEIPWFYDAEGELRKWTRQNLDAYMKAKHLYSFMPHDMTPDEVLDNYGDDGGAFPIIMASQAYAAEFPSLKEALRTDNLSFQLDRHEAETATRQLEDQFKALLGSYYFEPRSLQHFLIGYWWRDISHENVRNALIGEGLLDAPDTVYDEEEDPEEHNDLQSSNDDIAEEVRAFLNACRTSAKVYYEAAPGGWLSPSDFSGFILPSSLEETLRPELEKYNVPIHTYDLTEQEALALGNPWTLAKSPWLREEVDERRNAAIRDFLEDRDVSFSLFGEEQDSPSSSRDFPVPSSRFPLALSPTRLAEAFHAVRQGAPVAAELPPADAQDGPQTLSRLARQAYMVLRASTRMADLPHHPRARRAELAKPLLRLSDGRTAHLGKAGWKRFMSSSPSLRSLAAMAQLPSLVDSALYLYSVPSFDNDSPEQNRAWHYYLGRVQDSVHGASYVLLSFREDTRGSFFDGLETAPQKDIDQIGNVSARPDSGFIHRAKNGGSLPDNTLHAIRAFVNFVDAHQGESLAAPNGQPSRLTPDQWYLVRTAPFLDYFGDWIRDPSASSVVLDDNGEPLVCYRGLKQTYNPGVSRRYTWVSASRELSASYAAGGPVLDLFVAARRPFRLPDGLTRQSPDHFRETVKQELATQGQYRAAARKLDTLLQGTQETEVFKLWERHGELKDILSSLGYDSVMTEENGVMTYGLFHPGQAKSAVGNCGSYDITLRDITFSLRGNEASSHSFTERSASPLTAEEQSILARARDAGNDLLAPNGQPTRLTEKQWAQARTKAFLAWFGDWLRDPASASKTLDENGEPIVLYHGGSFDIRQSPSVFDGVPHVDGIFFSDSAELAKSYQAYQGGGITAAWLNLRTPFRAQDKASARLPWVDRYIDYWQEEEGWTDRYTGEPMDRESVRDMIREGSLYEYDMGERWQDFLGWVRQHHDGYLGHDPTDMGALIAVAFHSNQIKSSFYNNGAFDPANPDITFSLAPDASQATIPDPPSSPVHRPSTAPLAALHSLSAERLLAADKLGGLPLPSIAVTRLDRPYTWDGEENIYLVGSPALADPAQGVEIHDRDMWSGHFPELRWIPRARRQREDFYEQARQASLRYYAEENISPLRFLKNALDGDHRGELESKLRKSDLSLAVFALEQGYAPRPIMTKTRGRLHTGDRLFYAEILKMLPEKDADTLHPDKQPDFCAAMQRAIERYRKQSSREEGLSVTQARIRKSNLRNMETELDKAQGDGFLDISWQALQDARYAGRPIPDWGANFQRFEKYAARHQKAHDAWVRDKLERWLNPVPRIKGTALKATLENLVEYMLESKRAGAERAVVFSTGLLRAKQSRRFHSLEEVKAARDTLVTTEENHASEQKAQDYIHRFQAALNEIDESFAAYDNAVEALSLVRGQPTRAKILAALARIYRGTSFRGRIARDRRLPDLGVLALVSIHDELRDYFEGVPQRAVLLSEFSHAVLPASLRRDKAVRDILRRHNIRPLFHDGTQQGRFQALSSLIGTSVSFSLHTGGSPQMSPIVPRPSASSQPETPSFSVIGPRAATWDQYVGRAFPGRDDGLPRAEMDASRSSLRDHAAPFRQALRRELAALRRSLPAETKAKIRRYLLLHRKFYLNKKTLEPEKHVPQWRDYLALSGEKETWTALLAPSLLRAGLCGGSLPFARQLSASSLSLLVREDRAAIASLADRGLAETPLPLADRLDYPELFAAYPQLRPVPVVTDLLEGFRGFYSPAERAIYLHRSMDDPQEIRSVLLHEVQHAIQHIEGFARGGTAEAARQFYESQRRAAAQALAEGRRFMDWLSARERMIAALKYMLTLARAPRRVLRTSYRYTYDAIPRRLTGEERILDMARHALADLSRLLEEFYDCNWNTAPEYELPWPYHYNLLTPSGIAQCLEDARKTPSRRQAFRRTPKPDLRALNSAWLKYERLSSLASHELYLRLAGEIEARNVQTRLDWPESRRAAEPFNMTLDYPGEALAAFRPPSSPTPGARQATTPNRPSSILPRTPESFSLASLHDIVSSLAAPSMQATRAADLVKDFGKAAENWRRVMSGKEEQPAAPVGAELYGMVSSLISSARLVLPPGYRSRVDLQMQWASVYAAMAESGQIPPKGSLRSGDAFYERFVTAMVNNTLAAASAEDARQILASIGSRRLDRVMSSVLDRVRDQLAYFAKDELYEKTMRRVEAVYPKKQPGKKSPRGRLEAQAYRLLARYRSMLASTPEVKAQAMASLNALHNGEPDADKRWEYEEDLLAWKTYGDYAGMSLPQAQAAMKQLLEFVMTGRSAWAAKLRQERGRAKYAARQIGRNLPAANNASSRAGSKIAYRTRLRKCLASLPYGFMSYSHLMLALEPVLGQRFSRERIKEITEANAALLNASNDRAAWLSAAIRRITGATSESAAEQWLVEFNTPQETGIILKPAITVRITLPVEEARDWLSLTKEERAARRKEIRKNDAIAETLTENVPEEEDIPLLRQALDDYESRTPDQQQYQRFLTTEREIEGEENAFPLTCSRDCALYAILLHEQEDYADKYDADGKLIRKGFLRREGFDEAAMAALYEFVGPAGLAYGYALREKLNETGQTLAHVYEERMGVPFALKENYFRATFDRNSTREKDTLAEPQGGAIATGKYGSLIERVPHAENLDFSRAASLVFLAAAAEQDNYIHTSHITAFWRALLLDKRLEQKLRQNLGEDLMGKLASWLDLIDGASLENNRAFLHLSRMQGMLQRAFAFSVLAGNGYVLLKQSTAILHGFFAGWVPSGVLERADGSHELAHRHVSFSSFLFHLAASNMGLGEISLKEVAQTPYFTARMRGEGAILAQIASQMPGQRYSRLEKPAEKLMNLIEAVDVKANLHAMHALANAYYARALQMNREHGNPFTEAQLRAAALEQVGLSLELGAQPLTKTQKSMNQAAGGILSRLAFVMKSEQLNKLGLMAAQWKTGSARNRVCAVQSWLSLGVASSLLAWFIAWLKGQEDDEDDEKKWRKYGVTALLGDLTSIPLAGEGVNYLASLFTGQRVFADNYARTLIDVGAITRSLKKEYEHLAQKKEMDWDAHFNNLTALVRAAGVGGAFSRSPSAVLSGYGALSLSAASGPISPAPPKTCSPYSSLRQNGSAARSERKGHGSTKEFLLALSVIAGYWESFKSQFAHRLI